MNNEYMQTFNTNHVVSDGRCSYNFSAGPCVLPRAVLEKSAEEMYNYRGSGQSVMELSHRQDEFRYISNMTKNEIRKFLKVPDNFRILLQQGGATMQYTAIVKNLIGLKPKRSANLVVSGLWSQQNYDEMSKFCEVNVVANNITANDCTEMVPSSEWKIDKDASFFYFCCNETVNGFEPDFDTYPWHLIPEGMPVVGDMSSNIGTKPVPWDKFAVAFMGAQKNLGPAGCTVIIVREDLLGHADKDVPIMCDWALHEKSPDTYYNTPAIFPMYVTGLNVSYMNQNGGLEYYTQSAA
jgi:phosphoserine aminotransferase|tara:strand:+ start:250 stop:1134 length:885 start_codon:yes stop_codon:yes gene_type:complete